MNNSTAIWLAIFGLLIFAVSVVSIGFVFGQTVPATIGTSSTAFNGTQYIPVYLPPQQVQQQETIQGVAQQTDTNSMMNIIGILFTGTIAPFIVKLVKDYREGQKEHEQNVFRLKAVSSALKEQNSSIEQTDKGDLEQAIILQKFMKMFHDHAQLKEMMDKITVKGVPIMQAQNNFVSDSENDLEEYYKNNNLPEDDFDTCNDPIVKQVTAVRNKSRK